MNFAHTHLSASMQHSGGHVVPASGEPLVHGQYFFGKCEVRLAERVLLVDGKPAAIGARAFDLLLVLIERRDRLVDKDELFDLVWPGVIVEENNLQVQVCKLRKHLGTQAITTLPGRGYRFTAALTETPAANDSCLPAPCPTNLAAELPPLFGRDQELATLSALLNSHRLVTLVGAAGIGKTRLALAAAHAALRDPAYLANNAFAEGVWFIELAALRDGALIVSTVAGALHITLGAGTALAAMVEKLQSSRMLLVLDNCEHLLADVAVLVEALLRAAPNTRIIATSQEALKIADEQVWRLDTLALPAHDTLDDARLAGAVMLFEARASAADPEFALTETNVAAVVDLCRHLDGIALAIELAAARIPLLGVDGLRARLGERLRLLTNGSRLAPPRHRTLCAALEWSHALLTPPQQIVFRRLGVMAGSFALEAAQQIAADATIDEWAVLDHLGALVDKSLVAVDTDSTGAVRYRLLESMRHFALRALESSGEAATMRARHLDFYLHMAEAAKPHLCGEQQGSWLNQLDLDRENFLAAHATCEQAEGGGKKCLRLVHALVRYWFNRGLLTIGHQITTDALARPDAQLRDLHRCQAMRHLGWLCFYRGQYAEAEIALHDSIAIGRELGAHDEVAQALMCLGNVALNQRAHQMARAHMEQALALARQCGDDAALIGPIAGSLAEVERVEGRLQIAVPLYEEALRCARRIGDRLRVMIALNNLSMVSISLGKVAPVRDMLLESLAISDELGSRRGRLVVMEVCAGLAAFRDEPLLAARFDGASATHTVQMGRHRDPADEGYLMPLLQRARTAVGDGEFACAQADGRALAYEVAVTELRHWLQSIS